MPIPEFRPDSYLPLGVHAATQEEVVQRFGEATARRRVLMDRVAEWVVLARALGAHGLLLDGSFVTVKPEPGDVDAVCWLPRDFEDRYLAQMPEAMRLYGMLATRSPAELFGAFSRKRWEEWIAFFSQTRELDGRQKGLVEVSL